MPGILAAALALAVSAARAGAAPVRFALVGDFGNGSTQEADVANRLKARGAQFVATQGDNNYLGGTVADMDRAIGRDYHPFIKYPANSTSQYRGQGASQINFYPVVGNHDWDEGIDSHSSYYTFPQPNPRYYEFVRGSVHFFAIDSDGREPDGTSATSTQAQWLRGALARSTAPWKLVLVHHPPYSSNGSSTGMRWPFAAWGATAVVAGHAHNYERVEAEGIVYLVNGLGGASITASAATPIAGSRLRFDDDYGYVEGEADEHALSLEFVTRGGQVIDTMAWHAEVLTPANPALPEPGAGVLLAGLVVGLAGRRRRRAAP